MLEEEVIGAHHHILSQPVSTRRTQVLLYDSVDAYVADCKMFHNEVAAHVVTAVDYKDNATLLEDFVNRMASVRLPPPRPAWQSDRVTRSANRIHLPPLAAA